MIQHILPRQTLNILTLIELSGMVTLSKNMYNLLDINKIEVQGT